MTKKPKQARTSPKHIRWDELEKGIKYALDNAERLNKDAELLLKHDRYPSATFLSLVAKEEIGKSYLLADLWVAKKDLSPEEYSQIFRAPGAHKRKLSASSRAFLQSEAWHTMGDFFAGQDQESKETSLYMDYKPMMDDGYWSTPSKDLDDDILKGMGTDWGKMKTITKVMEESSISEQIKMNYAVIASLRKFLKEQGKVLPATPAPVQPVIVAPVRQPPKIRMTDEFTIEFLLDKYEECLTMLTRPDIKELPSGFPFAYNVPSLEELRDDVGKIPSQKGKKAIILYQLTLLRTNLFLEIHNKARNLGDQRNYEAAVSLMNEYATKIAIPFNRKESPLRSMARVTRNLRPDLLGPTPNYPRQWNKRYGNWVRRNKTLDNQRRLKAYLDLSYTFSMLHRMSFSEDNFPRLDQLTEDELNKFLSTGHFP